MHAPTSVQVHVVTDELERLLPGMVPSLEGDEAAAHACLLKQLPMQVSCVALGALCTPCAPCTPGCAERSAPCTLRLSWARA